MTPSQGWAFTTIALLGVLLTSCPNIENLQFNSDPRIIRGKWTGVAKRNCSAGSTTGPITWNADGSKLITGDNGNPNVRNVVWNTLTGARVSVIKGNAQGVVWTPDGQQVFGWSRKPESGRVLSVWNANTGELVRSLEVPITVGDTVQIGPISAISTISPDTTQFLSPENPTNPRLSILSSNDAKPLKSFDLTGIPGAPLDGYSLEARWSADGSRVIASGNLTGTISTAGLKKQSSPVIVIPKRFVRIWNANTGAVLRTWTGAGLFASSISPNGTNVILNSFTNTDFTYRIVNVADGSERALNLSISGPFGPQFTADGTQLLIGSGYGYGSSWELWDLASASKIKTLVPANSSSYRSAFSTKGDLTAVAELTDTASPNGPTCSIKLYKADGTEKFSLNEIELDRYAIQLDLKATYFNEFQYPISGTAKINDLNFTVRGTGRAGYNQRLQPLTSSSEPIQPQGFDLEVLDAGGKVVWQLAQVNIGPLPPGETKLRASLIDAVTPMPDGSFANIENGFRMTLDRNP
jgi:hypothetical protein